MYETVLIIVKVKVKSLCFNWAPRREGVVHEWRYSSTHSLTSAKILYAIYCANEKGYVMYTEFSEHMYKLNPVILKQESGL